MQLELILPLGRRKWCIAEKVPFCYILWHKLFLKGIGLKLLIEMKDDHGICAVSCRKSTGKPLLKLDFSISMCLLVRRAVLIKILFFSFLSSPSLMEKKEERCIATLRKSKITPSSRGTTRQPVFYMLFAHIPRFATVDQIILRQLSFL